MANFHGIAKAGETYAYEPETSKDQAEHIWLAQPLKTFVVEEAGEILGTYYLKAN
ncbi:hypothetical protein L9G16_02360 [Shewanella sp. A25]|nr:hypothetical protein [Shewanella shenzhenensis]